MAINMKTNDEIRARFKELSKTVFDNVNDMAAQTGVEQKSLDKFIKGESKGINTTTLMKVLERIGGEVILPGDIKPSICDMGDYAMVPKVKAKAGAGSSLLTDGEEIGLYAFRKDFLRRIGLEGNNDLVLFDVMGDSMEPTIMDKDTVMASKKETDPKGGQIYVIRVDDELLVKRILREPGKLIVTSDNHAHGSFEIDLAAPNPNFEIVGRVRWQGRVY